MKRIRSIHPTPDLADKLLSRVRDRGGCWEWTGSRDAANYGRVYVSGQGPRMAHRASYVVFVGPIAEGLVLDHLCRNPPCINPAHLEQVTHRENSLRGTSPMAVAVKTGYCKRGHLLAPPAQCKPCHALIETERRRKREAANPALREARIQRVRQQRARAGG